MSRKNVLKDHGNRGTTGFRRNASKEGPRRSCRVRGVAPGRRCGYLPLPQRGLHLFTFGLPWHPWKALKYSLKADCFWSSFLGGTPSASGFERHCDCVLPRCLLLRKRLCGHCTSALFSSPTTHTDGDHFTSCASPRNSLDRFREVLPLVAWSPQRKLLTLWHAFQD